MENHPNDLSDFFTKVDQEKFIQDSFLQYMFFDLNHDNFQSTLHDLLNSYLTQNEEGALFIFNQIIHSLSIRPKILLLVVDLIKHILEKNHGNTFSQYFMSLFLQFDQPLLQGLSILALLNECNLQHIFSDVEISNAATKFYENYQTRGYNCFSLISWFAPMLKKHSPNLYKEHIKRIKLYHDLTKVKTKTSDSCEKQNSSFYHCFSIMKKDKYHNFHQYVRSVYMPGSISYMVMNDDINSFQYVVAHMNINLNQKIYFNTWEYNRIAWSRPRLVQFAALHGSNQIFTYLVQNGADVYMKDKNHHTVSYYAIAGGSKDIIQKVDKLGLLGNHASDDHDINKEKMIETEYIQNIINNLIVPSIIFFRHDIFIWLKMSGIIVVDYEKDHVLHFACQSNNIRCILLCLENGCNVNSYDASMNTPLMAATSNNSYEAANILMRHKNINVNIKDSLGQTAFSIAAQLSRSMLVMKMMVNDKVDLNSQDNFGLTPLHHALEEAHIDTAREMIKNLKINVNIKDVNGDTPLHYALKVKSKICFDALLQREDIEINELNNAGDPPLFTAIKYIDGSGKFLKALLGHCKTNKFIRNNEGRNLLHIAAIEGNIDIIDFLIKQEGFDVNSRDDLGATPFHTAAENGVIKSIEYFINFKGIDVNIPDSEDVSL